MFDFPISLSFKFNQYKLVNVINFVFTEKLDSISDRDLELRLLKIEKDYGHGRTYHRG